MYNEYTLHILVGLPGSGKSYFAKTQFDKDKDNIIDLDSNFTDYVFYPHLYQWLEYNTKQTIILDGLFLSSTSIEKAIRCFKSWLKNKKGNIIIDYWKEDRENCLINDEIRSQKEYRYKDSKITINNATYVSEYDIRDICVKMQSDNLNIRYCPHIVHQMSDTDKIIQKYVSLSDYKSITSKEWCNGGTWGSYTGDHGIVEPDDKPEFIEFDDFLTELCPNITFLQYKKLYNTCVTIETHSESDYYGGHTTNSYYKCDIDELVETMKELNII